VIINGYKPLNDWWVLAAICVVMFLFGVLASQILNPLPETVREIMAEITRCHRDTQEVCSVIAMPDSSHAEVYLLYSMHVK